MQTAPHAALGLILHGPTQTANQEIILLDYRDKKVFKALWLDGFKSGKARIERFGNEEEINLTDSTKQFLLIGNDPPDGIFDTSLAGLTGINFRSHFTATSWLAAWKVKFPEARTSIAVIDPRPIGQADGVARSLQAILSSRDTTGHSLVPGAMVLNTPRLEAICQWFKSALADTRTVARDTPHLRELLKSTIWNELTSKSEDHHALSNVMGPMILSGDKIDPKCWEDPVGDGEEQKQKRSANAANRCKHILRQLLSACGLVSWEDKKAEDQESKPSETGKDLQILLLDDQAKQGWEDWVKECLPGAKDAMQVAVDPTTLVDAITKALTDDKGNLVHKDARFRLKLPGLENATQSILLLDLRLFSGKDEDERKFLKNQLLPLVNHFTGKPDLAWPGFLGSSSLFQRAKALIEAGALKPDTDEHHEVLTWLPRVVALADMSLPIILFSSTGRRDLVEPFKPYGNIITTFEKPRLNDFRASGDSGSGVRSTCVASLRGAVDRARRWLKGREAINRIQNTKLDALNAARAAFEGKKHFEIYHDESGQAEMEHFRVTSLLAGFETDSAARTYSSALAIKFHGINCADKDVLDEKGDKPTPDKYPKVAACRWNKEFWPKVKNDFPPCLAAVAVRSTDTQRSGRPDSIFDPEGLDTINWDLISLQWECLLVDVLPALFRNRAEELNQISIRIFGATRFRPVMLAANNADNAIREANSFLNALQDQWGIDLLQIFKDCSVKDGDAFVSEFDACQNKLIRSSRYRGTRTQFKLLWRSLKEDSFWKLVSEILFSRRESPHFVQISSALRSTLGITLMYGSGMTLDPRGRNLHYFADVVSGLAVTDAGKKEVSFTVEPFKETQSKALVSYRDRVLLILNANRMLDLRDCESEALACFETLDHNHPQDLACLALAERLGERLPVLSGESLGHLVALLETPSSWLSKNRLTTPQRINKQQATPQPSVASSRFPQNPSTTQRTSKPRRDNAAANFASQPCPTTQRRGSSRWMMKQYEHWKKYEQCGADWHTKSGFRVLAAMSRNNPKITVFADSTMVSTSALPADFRDAYPNQLDQDGNPIGIPWKPDAPSRPRQTPHSNHGPARAANQQLRRRNSEVNKAWIGPVPKGVNSDSLSSFVVESLPGWTPESVWAGGNEPGWWLPVSREAQVDVSPLPKELIFGDHKMSVSTTNPVG